MYKTHTRIGGGRYRQTPNRQPVTGHTGEDVLQHCEPRVPRCVRHFS